MEDEVALFAIAIPVVEIWEEWMPYPKRSAVLKKIATIAAGVGDSTGTSMCPLLFYSAEDRSKAMKMIRKAFPETLAAPMAQMAYVSREYLPRLKEAA